MEIRHLKLVRAVAEEGNLTRAGEKLFLTQSALSHQLKEIEGKLGTPLFQRIQKRMVLTQVGKKILHSARVVLEEIEKAETEVRNYISGDAGLIRISTECYTCYHWLPALLKSFHQEYPNVEVVVMAEATQEPLPFLLAGKLDIVILNCPDEKHNSLVYTPLFTDEMVAIVDASHRLANRAFLKAKDFEEETLILHKRPTKESTLFKKIFDPAGVAPAKIMEIQLTEAVMEMVKAGFGMTVLAKWAANPYLQSKELKALKLTKAGLRRTWYAVTLKDERAPGYLRAFAEYLSSSHPQA